jgi:hypothetical protein
MKTHVHSVKNTNGYLTPSLISEAKNKELRTAPVNIYNHSSLPVNNKTMRNFLPTGSCKRVNNLLNISKKAGIMKMVTAFFVEPRTYVFGVALLIANLFFIQNSFGQITPLSAWSNLYHNNSTATQNITYTVPTGSHSNR